MDNIARHSGHISEERRARQDDGVVANKAADGEEEDVEVEKQLVPNAASFLKHLECQVSNQTGSIDGDCDVC